MTGPATESSFDRVTRLLVDKTGTVGRNGQYRCPAHDDDDPSLSVHRGERGVVLTCHRGCTANAVVDALGIRLSDLFDRPAERSKPVIDTTYAYRDENDELLFEVVRYSPKSFRQRRPDGNGGWVWNLNGVRRPLFNLAGVKAAILADVRIWITEGEKCAQALDRAGEIATCNSGGAGKWRPEHTEQIAGAAEVIIVADKDEPGRQHACQVADAIRPHVGTVRIVEAAVGKDAADHLGAGLPLEDFRPVDLASANGKVTGKSPDAEARPVLIRVSDVQPEAVEWLWPGRLPVGKVTVLDGDPGLGKSTLTTDIAARLTTGSPMPDGQRLDRPRGVVLLSAEDGIADTIRPRLDAAGADTSKVFVLDAVPDADDDGRLRPPSLPGDVAAIAAAVERTDAALVIVDPLMAYLHGAVNSYRDQDVRRALHPLKVLAEQTGAAVVLVRHLNKSGGTTAVYRGGGSIGIIGAARLGLLVAVDPDDPDRRILAVAKSNLAVIPPSLAYRLVTDETHGVARVLWEGTSAHTADALLAAPASDDDRAAQDDAESFLLYYLAAGRQRATDVKKAGKAAGIAERTLDRARHRAGVTSQREGFGPGSVCWWEPHTRQPDADTRHTRQPSESGDYGGYGSAGGEYAEQGTTDQSRGTTDQSRGTTVTTDDCQDCATEAAAVERLLAAFPGSTVESEDG